MSHSGAFQFSDCGQGDRNRFLLFSKQQVQYQQGPNHVYYQTPEVDWEQIGMPRTHLCLCNVFFACFDADWNDSAHHFSTYCCLGYRPLVLLLWQGIVVAVIAIILPRLWQLPP